MPTVSIGMPVFNGAQFIEEAIESLLAQEYEDFELIISDNASTDDTEQICRSYEREDARITYSRLPKNMGAAYNYNRVFELSTGELFKWAAHDDQVHPRFLSDCVDVFSSCVVPPALVHPAAEVIDAEGRHLRFSTDRLCCMSNSRSKRVSDCIRSFGMVTSVFGLFYRETLAKTRLIGPFNSSDYVLLVEAAALGKIVFLDGDPTFQLREHQGTSMGANATAQAVLEWYDPDASLAIPPGLRLQLECLRSTVLLRGLSIPQRCAFSNAVLMQYGRTALGRWRRQLFVGREEAASSC